MSTTTHSRPRRQFTTQARAGAPMTHHPAWVGHHTGGSPLTPTVHPCRLLSGGCGWLTAQQPDTKITSTDSLSKDLETQEMECQHEMAVAATSFRAHACWPGRRNEDMSRAWRRQVSEATRWSKVRGLAGVVCREVCDVGVMWSSWDTFVFDGVPTSSG